MDLWWFILCVNSIGPQGCPESWLQIISGCAWRCSKRRLAFEFMDWGKKTALPSVGGAHQIHWEPNRTKWWRKAAFTFHLILWVGTSIFCSQQFGFLGLQTQPRIYTVSSLAVSLWITPSAFWVPLALFIWRKLTNTSSLTALKESLCESKTNTK